ncbi:MAG: glycosyltransferase [Gemmatimonadaceae bacterium]|nr:glycosyltransferase [Gemmatimonadaceae bacterium]
MKVVLSTTGRFHSFELGYQLARTGDLHTLFTGRPRFKTAKEKLDARFVKSFPWIETPRLALLRAGIPEGVLARELEYLGKRSFDAFVARSMPSADVFCGLSGSALQSGVAAKKKGMRYFADRGSSHIRFQDRILREEYALQKLRFRGIDPRVVDLEEREYELADAITVPSRFAAASFLELGIPQRKVHVVPYGVDLQRFRQTTRPSAAHFDILFAGLASIQKGIPYLVEAFARFRHPAKRLTLAGRVSPELHDFLARKLRGLSVRFAGSLPQDELARVMSASHVMVLPSVQEGLALVQAQALACGCPVIATTNTGAEDIFTHGQEGFILPIRDSGAITRALDALAGDEPLRVQMSEAGLRTAAGMGGWEVYGENMRRLFEEIV